PPPTTTLFPYTTLFRSRMNHCFQKIQILDIGGDRCAKEDIITLAKPLVLGREGDVNQILLFCQFQCGGRGGVGHQPVLRMMAYRSEEHTSELQSRFDLV